MRFSFIIPESQLVVNLISSEKARQLQIQFGVKVNRCIYRKYTSGLAFPTVTLNFKIFLLNHCLVSRTPANGQMSIFEFVSLEHLLQYFLRTYKYSKISMYAWLLLMTYIISGCRNLSVCLPQYIGHALPHPYLIIIYIYSAIVPLTFVTLLSYQFCVAIDRDCCVVISKLEGDIKNGCFTASTTGLFFFYDNLKFFPSHGHLQLVQNKIILIHYEKNK